MPVSRPAREAGDPDVGTLGAQDPVEIWRRASEPGRGRHADRPSELPVRGWQDIARRVVRESRADNVPLLAAGVAFYGLVSLFPAMVAVVSLYGLVADPADVADQLSALAGGLPAQAGDLLIEQITKVAGASSGALGLGVVVGLGVALWSASSGMTWLLSALSLVYDEREGRSFLQRRGRALVLTVGAALTLVVSVALIAALPAVAGLVGLEDTGTLAAAVLRWPLLAALVVLGLSTLYRHGPDRAHAKWRWVTWGSAIATALWLVASAGFALYASVAGRFDETYGPIGGVVVLMLWLHLSVLAVLLGAEINAEMEHQTVQDTTTGAPRPIGARGAAVADHLGDSAADRSSAPDDRKPHQP